MPGSHGVMRVIKMLTRLRGSAGHFAVLLGSCKAVQGLCEVPGWARAAWMAPRLPCGDVQN